MFKLISLVATLASLSMGATPTLLVKGCSGSPSPVTQAAITLDTTGADFIIISDAGTGTLTVQDTLTNAWTQSVVQTGNTFKMGLFYSTPASVGVDNFQTNNSNNGAAICVEAWSNMATSNVSQNVTNSHGITTGTFTINPGAVTPIYATSLVVSSAEFEANNATMTITESGAGCIAVDSQVQASAAGSLSLGIGSCLMQTPVSDNPTWNNGGTGAPAAAASAVFSTVPASPMPHVN